MCGGRFPAVVFSDVAFVGAIEISLRFPVRLVIQLMPGE